MSKLDDTYELVNTLRQAAREHEGYLRVQAVPILLEAISLQLEVLSYQLQSLLPVETTEARNEASGVSEPHPVGSTVSDNELPGMWSHSDFTGGSTDDS